MSPEPPTMIAVAFDKVQSTMLHLLQAKGVVMVIQEACQTETYWIEWANHLLKITHMSQIGNHCILLLGQVMMVLGILPLQIYFLWTIGAWLILMVEHPEMRHLTKREVLFLLPTGESIGFPCYQRSWMISLDDDPQIIHQYRAQIPKPSLFLYLSWLLTWLPMI